MNAKESKKLKAGDKVLWKPCPTISGVVKDANWHAVQIEWSDGQAGIIDHNDMDDVGAIKQAATA